MRVYRICRIAHRELDGRGALLYGGRWNSPGRPIVYTSSTLSLAALEYLIHLEQQDAPSDLVALTIDLPDDSPAELVEHAALPRGWEKVAEPPACKEIGDRWVQKGGSLILQVPAAPVPEELNLLLNPQHRDARRIRIVTERPFFFDPRLLA
ncbi:MAG TPA: RES family NAD+ phosphorylase [Gemmatimonadales bacterium]|nr:RES family NAD+ phosphorylase [Gemmatimonadales bacterium]